MRYKILAFMLCGMLAAIAGILDFSFIQTTQPNIGLSHLPGLRRGDHRRGEPRRRQGHGDRHHGGALLLAELQQRPRPALARARYAQQLFLGFVTIGAVALDLGCTHARRRGRHERRRLRSDRRPASASGSLRKRYGNTVALDGLDLDLRPGEVLGIAGPNGAGKSTLVRILAGEEAADEGELLLDGGRGAAAMRRRPVAVVHQEPQLFPNLTRRART